MKQYKFKLLLMQLFKYKYSYSVSVSPQNKMAGVWESSRGERDCCLIFSGGTCERSRLEKCAAAPRSPAVDSKGMR